MLEKLKVVIVDPNPFYLRMLSDAMNATRLAETNALMRSGGEAIEYIKKHPVDVVLLDVALPDMDGLEALERLKQINPQVIVIMLCGSAKDSTAGAGQALERGATDFIVKPAQAHVDRNMNLMKNVLGVLLTQIKIKRAVVYTNQLVLSDPAKVRRAPSAGAKGMPSTFCGADILLIASSTGGPVALETLLRGFTTKLNKPVLIVQHMPPDFTRMLAQSLSKKCVLPVQELENDMLVRPGRIVLARGGYHMVVTGSLQHLQATIDDGPPVNSVRPAADVLFETVAQQLKGAKVLVVVLTGMGNDGTNGVRLLKQHCNCYCLTQNEKTCVVYGMPRSVDEAGLSDESLPLTDLAGRVMELI